MNLQHLERFWTDAPACAFNELRAQDVGAWAADVRRVVARLLRIDLAGPPHASLVDAREWETRRASRYAFAAGTPDEFHGIYVEPRGAIRGHVLVCPGLHGRPEQVAGLAPPDYPDRAVAAYLTDRGFATLTLDYGFGSRTGTGHDLPTDIVTRLAVSLLPTGHSVLGYLVRNAIAALHWLAARRPQLGLSLVGHSLGGHVALHASLVWPERVPVVLASAVASYRTLFHDAPSATAAHVVPGMYRFADVSDLLGALAAAPLQIQHGSEDPYLPTSGARSMMDAAARVYAAGGWQDRFDASVLSMGHGTDLERTATFLDRWVRPATLAPPTLAPTAPAPVTVPPARVVFDTAARAEILECIDDSLSRGSLTLGPHTVRFEQALRPWVGTDQVVAVCSGTAAIEIALRTLNVAGRVVLAPANTFLATATAAMHAGARVQFVDIEAEGLGMDPEALKIALAREPDVAAVVVVHIGGLIAPSVLDVLRECHARDIPVIEDAAHALGSAIDGRPAGSLGRLAAFSFYPTKIVTSGEGGIVCTSDAAHADLARCLRDHGKRAFEQNVHVQIGSNWRLSELHAAVGRVHLDRLGAFIDERSGLAARYDRLLADVPEIRPLARPARCRSNFYKYVALLDAGIAREPLRRHLAREHGVALSGEIYPIACPRQPALQALYAHASFPAAEQFCERHICLPLFAGMTETQQDRVVQALTASISALAMHAKGQREGATA
jgi:perosamine synthetase